MIFRNLSKVFELSIQEAKVKLNLAISPGCWLMASDMILNTESKTSYNNFLRHASQSMILVLRWLPPVLHFLEPLNFTKDFLAHHDGLLPVLARSCYNSF